MQPLYQFVSTPLETIGTDRKRLPDWACRAKDESIERVPESICHFKPNIGQTGFNPIKFQIVP
jgi:hypothetical protein